MWPNHLGDRGEELLLHILLIPHLIYSLLISCLKVSVCTPKVPYKESRPSIQGEKHKTHAHVLIVLVKKAWVGHN